jgi:hypothetical protein
MYETWQEERSFYPENGVHSPLLAEEVEYLVLHIKKHILKSDVIGIFVSRKIVL